MNNKTRYGAGNRRTPYPWAILAVCLLFLCIILTSYWYFKVDTHLIFTLGACVIFSGTLLFRNNRQLLASHISKIGVIITAQCLLYFAALIYARYPKLELQQLFLNIGSLLVFLSVYVSFLRGELYIKFFLKLFALIIVGTSIINIELATSGYLRPIFESVAALFNMTIPSNYAAFEANTRITTILGNANVYAPIAVFGMFVSVWNFGKPGGRSRNAFIHIGLAIICGTAFILCFSLGTILAYIVALIVCLFAEEKGRRSSQFLVHAFVLIVSIVGAGAVFTLRSISITPTLAVLGIAAGAAILYTKVKPIRLPILSGRLKIVGIAGIAALCAVLIGLSMLLKGSYALNQGDSFRRAVTLKAGTYSFKAELDKNALPDATMIVEISSMSYAEAALKEKTVLKTVQLKSGEAVDFNVPDSSAAVFVTLTANSDLTVTSALIDSGGAMKQLSLHYTVVPEFIVNRLQGLWVNDNAIQRFVFFRDGIRLGLRSPIVGLGGGGFEGGLSSVSDYHYVTTHVHNEYIERFTEGGAIGALLFIALAVWVFRALLKARSSEKAQKLLPLLAGCMTLIFTHALLEVDFLYASYRIAAYVLMALTAATCRDCLELSQKLRAVFITAISILFVGNTALAVGHYSAVKLMLDNPTLDSFQTAIIIDPINKNDYRLSYLMSTKTMIDEKVLAQQAAYLRSMENDVYGYYTLAEFYFTKAMPDYQNGVVMAEAYIKENRVNPAAWDMMFSLYAAALETGNSIEGAKQQISESVIRMCAYLEELNKTLPKEIKPKMTDNMYQLAKMINLEQTDPLSN